MSAPAIIEVDTGYVRGVLDSTGRLGNIEEPGYITDYWRKVVKALCDEVDRLRAAGGDA